MEASIGIFNKKLTYKENSSVCEIPDEVFLAAQRVASTTVPEVVHSLRGFYIIEHSPNGPFSEYAGEWIPVIIYRIETYSSGGIREEELKLFKELSENIESQDEKPIDE